ncbi:MAG: hypothetical protein IPK19_24525 [Chloroflexi bacterium]|nr:hypothetical protein [Chloroflexota bacterium]
MKWSDGTPFTTDNLVFMWEDLCMNAEVTPGGPPGFFSSPVASRVQVERVDDLTIKYTFSVPYYVAPYYFTHWGDWYGGQQLLLPGEARALDVPHQLQRGCRCPCSRKRASEHWYELPSD